jgi:hypothetical protein
MRRSVLVNDESTRVGTPSADYRRARKATMADLSALAMRQERAA